MNRLPRLSWAAAFAVCLVAGCSETTPAPAPAPSPSPAPSPAPTPEKKADATPAFSPKQLAAIKELPAEEQNVAMSQAKCPVNGSVLGAMGKPFKVMVKGQPVYLCCDGCEEEVKTNPDAILAKITKK